MSGINSTVNTNSSYIAYTNKYTLSPRKPFKKEEKKKDIMDEIIRHNHGIKYK